MADLKDWPVRDRSARGQPPPFSDFTRRCVQCGACFIGLAPGKTGERGLWLPNEMRWACSRECWEAATGLTYANLVTPSRTDRQPPASASETKGGLSAVVPDDTKRPDSVTAHKSAKMSPTTDEGTSNGT